MSLFNLMSKADQQRELAMAAATQEHLERWQRCKKTLDSLSRQDVRRWLERLPLEEREKCRTVLNNLIASRKAKADMRRG